MKKHRRPLMMLLHKKKAGKSKKQKRKNRKKKPKAMRQESPMPSLPAHRMSMSERKSNSPAKLCR